MFNFNLLQNLGEFVIHKNINVILEYFNLESKYLVVKKLIVFHSKLFSGFSWALSAVFINNFRLISISCCP